MTCAFFFFFGGGFAAYLGSAAADSCCAWAVQRMILLSPALQVVVVSVAGTSRPKIGCVKRSGLIEVHPACSWVVACCVVLVVCASISVEAVPTGGNIRINPGGALIHSSGAGFPTGNMNRTHTMWVYAKSKGAVWQIELSSSVRPAVVRHRNGVFG